MSQVVERAVTTQMRLRQWWTTDTAATMIYEATKYAYSGDRSAGEMAALNLRGIHEGLVSGGTYAVEPEICDLLDSVAATLPDTTIRASDFPTQAGYVYYAKPIPLGFSEEQMYRMARSTGRVTLEIPPELAGFIWIPAANQGKIVYLLLRVREGTMKIPALGWVTHVVFGETWKRYKEGDTIGISETMQGETAQGFNRILRHLYSLLLFMQQKIVSSDKVRIANRQARRLVERAGHEAAANLVTLRKRQRKESGEEQTVEWSCRWLVGGHWRNQYYPKTQEHRPIFIFPYEKGPDDKPLKASSGERIFRVSR